MFQFRKALVWSVALHVVVIALAFTIPWRAALRLTFIQLTPPASPGLPDLPQLGGTEVGRGPSGGLGRRVPITGTPQPVAQPTPPTKLDSPVLGPPVVAPAVPAPHLADSRLWPAPRPALPSEVAEALYNRHDTIPRDSSVVRRLRIMVDSLNQIVDIEQREHRLPSWTTERTGKKFGIDSTGIYVAGVRIPALALAMLGNLLPQGNFDESLRAQHMEDIRQDILQAARRTETLHEFRRYVHEIRERKQAERDAERRARGDTTTDTVRAIP